MKTSAYLITGVLVLVMGSASIAAAKGGARGGMGPERMDAMFTTLDTDGDGKITTEEFAAASAKRFAEADANSNGFLSSEEMTAMAVKQREKTREARAARRSERMLTKLDADKDGKLSLEELAAAPGPERMLEKLDADSDDALSREEVADLKERMEERREKGHKHGHKHGHDHGAGKGRTPWWMQ